MSEHIDTHWKGQWVVIWLLLGTIGPGQCPAQTGSTAPGVAERLYLSGTGFDATVGWDFRIDRGRRAGAWWRLAVPSQWELEGFGEYAYGRDVPSVLGERAEIGRYRHRFRVPDDWFGRPVRLVFEGAMTDTTVRVNGASAGPTHQGGFTRFEYEVGTLLNYGAENSLEVEVSEASSDRSVNRAEREADYWVFGGIYRPVYLEVSPSRSISHFAIDARHDGELAVELELTGTSGTERVMARVLDSTGSEVGPSMTATVFADGRSAFLDGRFPQSLPWSAEQPNLYHLQMELMDGDEVLHRVRRRFGFRTVRVRPGEGLFVNGRRVLLKGVNRHSFWPDSGRTLNPELNRRDAELIKSLNANAVRTSHYPPDSSFLEACDELGIYVIDELPGWHDAYRPGVGSRLIGELVRRDVNHPSVILWANGNEGGWNSLLDSEFARHDPQDRAVLHPGSTAAGIDAAHYPTYSELRDSLGPDSPLSRLLRLGRAPALVLPTEMLHALYDGGGGAGLADYWRAISDSPRGAGGFLWALLDEGVVRTDRGGVIDTHGNQAPDGIVGPYREPEASFQTVRQIWSPVQIERADWRNGRLDVTNSFFRTDFSECTFRWLGLAVSEPAYGSEPRVVFEVENQGPRLGPGERGRLSLGAIPDASFDALRLVALDPNGREMGEWVGWTGQRASLLETWLPVDEEPVTLAESARPEWVESVEVTGTAEFRTVWTEFPSGWIRLEVEHDVGAGPEAAGFTVRLSDFEPSEIEWLGDGPWPVWANRLAGPQPGLWRRSLDNDTPGYSARGFYSGVRWMNLFDANTSRASVTVVVESAELFLGVLSPRFPEDAGNASAQVPSLGTISFLTRIPAMGTKFHDAAEIGPEAGASGRGLAMPRRDVIWLRFDPQGINL